MKKVFLFLSLCLLVVSFTNDTAAQQQKLRIGVAGIQIENSVFMPNRQPIVGRPLTLPDYLSPDSAMGHHLVAVHDRHFDVGNDNIRFYLPVFLQAFFPVAGDDHLITAYHIFQSIRRS